MFLQIGQRLFGMPAAFQRGIIRKHNFTGLVYDKGFASGHKELSGYAECIEHFVARIAEQRVGEPVIGLKFFVTFDGASIDADDDGPCLDEVGIPVTEATGFFCADHAFIFGVKEDHQAVFPDMVPAVEEMPVLVCEGERRDAVAYCQLLVPVAAGTLAGAHEGEGEEELGKRKKLFHDGVN